MHHKDYSMIVGFLSEKLSKVNLRRKALLKVKIGIAKEGWSMTILAKMTNTFS
jgi:hypothetical protein